MKKIDFRKESFTRVPNFIFDYFREGMSSTDFIVYSYLLKIADNESKQCIITSKSLGENLGYSQRTASSSVSSLSKLGLIKVTNRYRADGGRIANLYTMLG